MPIQLTTAQVWETIEKELFAVVGMVNAAGEARTAGLVYIVRERKLFIATGRDTWKARHMAANPHVSVTIPIAKRVPIMPWLKIPQATITFQGTARVFPAAEASPELRRAILMHKADDRAMVAGSCIVKITPVGEFVTYGVGIRLMDMREPAKARGRAPVL
jgi:hypothetical protein